MNQTVQFNKEHQELLEDVRNRKNKKAKIVSQFYEDATRITKELEAFSGKYRNLKPKTNSPEDCLLGGTLGILDGSIMNFIEEMDIDLNW